MFFKKSKKKLDPRVRFQHSTFTRKLSRAKTYQRQSRPRPEGRLHGVLQKIGLDSIWSQIAVVGCLGVIVFFVYVPGLLFIRHITITGISGGQADSARAAVERYFDDHMLPWPQQNIVLLRKSKLSAFILANDHSLGQVTMMKKKLFHTLDIEIQPKRETYLVISADARYMVYDDGTVVSVMPSDSAIQRSDLVPVVAGPTATGSPGQAYFAPALSGELRVLLNEFMNKTGQTVSSIIFPGPEIELKTPSVETPSAPAAETSGALPTESVSEPVLTLQSLPLDPAEVSISTPKKQNGKDGKQNFRIIIDPRTDISDMLAKLGQLLKKLPPERYNNLSYVDMRLPDRAYVCLVRTPCATAPLPAVPIIPPNPLTTESTKP